MKVAATAVAALVLAEVRVGAVPPPPPAIEQTVVLPLDQCRVPLDGTVRAYAQPVHGFVVSGPTVLRVLADGADPALLFDLEQREGDDGLRPVATGVGLSGGDVRIALPAAGRYLLRLLMVGDAARNGRAISYRISLSRAPESGAIECRTESGG